ncbi:uncharacterized protein LOC130363049 isoform X3 [Hyla sarda]|uniref:uncharacterized protein LOC130363049 isoform X3 n=1 Tax=Hyla sarda TaxID=327740 RepID=UPI0024C3043C|nr:uncharacterized protein LOC130363049 isoform X3 [Hyla sarda]
MKTTLVLLLCITKCSSAYPLWQIMQLYNTIGRISQQSQVNPGFVMPPAQVLQNQISQILPMQQLHPYQILSQYLLANLMQPGPAPPQISSTYPVFGNLLPMSVPNTQMLPIVFTQQGLLSGSDSEEGMVSGVLMVPVNTGLQGDVISMHQAGVSISGPDSTILMGQPALNPVGQQGIDINIQRNETVLVESELPGNKHQEWVRDDAPGAGIIQPTNSPHARFWKTPSHVTPTVPSDIFRGDMTESPRPTTENWILCNAYVPDHEELQGLTRGDGHIPVMAPECAVIKKIYESQNQMESTNC